MSATFGNFCKIFSSTEWFQQHRESTNEIESMEVDELNKCLPKLYVSVRKTDGSYFKKTSLLSIRATLDRHLKAPKSFKNMSLSYFIFWNNHQVIILKQLVASGTQWFQQQQESTNEIESMAEKPKWGERKWRIIFRRRGSVAMVAKFLNDNKPKTSQKWIRTLSNFVDLIQFQFICSLILLGKFSEVESGRTVSKCRKRKREILCFFHYSKQRACE